MKPVTPQKLFIFDTTLRDGEQSPGAAMNTAEKIRIAQALEALGVDIIEAGFAASSPGDFASLQAISQVITKATISSLARANVNDVHAAGKALQQAQKKRIHIVIASSALHMEKKLHMTPEQVIERSVEAIQVAKAYTDDIEFSAEDATRADPVFLKKLFAAAIAAGATTVNIPDTVGYAIPSAMAAFVKDIIENTQGSDQVIWSTHCHNDLGMATSNTLAAVQAGVRQVECTINGMGERAGNASLEEVVMAVKTRNDVFGLAVDIDTTKIVPLSKLVAQTTDYPVQKNKAIVGANAFAHESGIHQDGVLKCRETYEIMSAQSVGWQENRITLGKLSGRNAFRSRLSALGLEVGDDEQLNVAFKRFKELADQQKNVSDADLSTLFTLVF